LKTLASEILAEIVAGIRDARRPKIIAVFAGTKAEAEYGVRHAQAGNTGLPIWVWCAETGAIAGCDRVFSLADRSEIQAVWPALAIVAWTGRPGAAWKLQPLFTPPFRVLALNEDGGFFAATPRRISQHLTRRVRDARVSWQRRAREETWSALYRSGQHARDLAGVAWSFLYRMGQRTRDIAGLAWSVLYRAGERARDVARLALSFVYRAGYWLWELMLALLALMARATPPLVRMLMARAGRSHVRRVDRAEERSDFIEVSFANRAWPGAAMRRAMRSQADFVVLRREGETQDAGPLLAMARELGAFAVARQCAHSAWRPRIIAKHPFRCLQPGEATEVRAPWSPLMVIRREWLERLGCPEALTSGAALMLLFWKSSAAGLTSYAMGTGGPVTDEPAMALEDAEFVGRLLWSPKLKRHAGRPFPLLRGNIARAPARQQGFRGKPRVLIVSPYLPFPLSHGGAVRIYNLCRALSDEVDFVLACFREKDETVCYDELHRIFRHVWIVDNDEANYEKHGDPDVPAQVAGYRNTAMGALIRRLCNEGMADLVQLEYTQMAEYRDYTGGVPVILVEHDITFTLHRQLAEPGSGRGRNTAAGSSSREWRCSAPIRFGLCPRRIAPWPWRMAPAAASPKSYLTEWTSPVSNPNRRIRDRRAPCLSDRFAICPICWPSSVCASRSCPRCGDPVPKPCCT